MGSFKYHSFRDMPVWEMAFLLSLEVFELVSNLPKCEDYGLTSQIRRSANGVSSTIAEGFGRKTNKDKAYFYIIARDSAFETQNHLLYGNKVNYFDKTKVDILVEKYQMLIHQKNTLLKYLILNLNLNSICVA